MISDDTPELIIQGLTADAYQENNIRLIEGERLLLTLRYLPNKWIMHIKYKDFAIYGLRLVLGDMTKQFHYQIPFAVKVVNTLDDGDPYFLEDFITQRIQLFIEYEGV